ncbi:hypothetical protein ABPG74_008770 [Tetrahymena malaccensis]
MFIFNSSVQIVFLKENILKKSVGNSKNPFIKNQQTWLKNEQQNQVVMLMIDALNYQQVKQNFVGLDKILESEPDNTIYLKSKTDSLTVTGPRILSIMTGTNPNVIDLVQNVEEPQETKIDNILFKLKDQNRTVYHTGANTPWFELFPGSFTKFTDDEDTQWKIFSDSDEGAIQFTKDAMNETFKNGNEEKYVDLIICHLLGLDHIYHSKKDAYHPSTGKKFKQFEEFLAYILDNIGNRTLIIQSDHGITPNGNHGDGSSNETDIFFFAYSKKGFAKNSNIVKQLLQEIPQNAIELPQNSEEKHALNPEGQLEGILQIDLAVNLANILGLSLPYSSLGMIWPVFYQKIQDGNEQDEERFKNTIANDCYTVIKQQIQLIKENIVYQTKFSQENLKMIFEKENEIDQKYIEFQISKSNLSKLQELFVSAFNLNMQIKGTLSNTSNLEMIDTLKKNTYLLAFIILVMILTVIIFRQNLKKSQAINMSNLDETNQEQQNCTNSIFNQHLNNTFANIWICRILNKSLFSISSN